MRHKMLTKSCGAKRKKRRKSEPRTVESNAFCEQVAWDCTSQAHQNRFGRGLRVLGRTDRSVKVLGELVNLEELEKFWRGKLKREVALVARPDKRRGMNLFLFYEGIELDLARWNTSLPGPERITEATAVDLLPRSELGKIDRSALAKFD